MKPDRYSIVEVGGKTYVEFSTEGTAEDDSPEEYTTFRVSVDVDEKDMPATIKRKGLKKILDILGPEFERFGGAKLQFS